MKYHLLYLSSVTWSLTSFPQSQLSSQKQCMGLLLGLYNTWFFVMQERILTLLLSPSFKHIVLLILCQDEAEPQPRGRVFISSELFPASSHLTWELYAWLSCALLIRVKIYPTTKVYLYNFINEHCFKYWIKYTFIGQQFYMPINIWIRYVMSWIYKVAKNWMIISIAKEPVHFFQIFL